jgi:hypothetical protein
MAQGKAHIRILVASGLHMLHVVAPVSREVREMAQGKRMCILRLCQAWGRRCAMCVPKDREAQVIMRHHLWSRVCLVSDVLSSCV